MIRSLPLEGWRHRIAGAIGALSFYALLALIALLAIPYGSAEPWWKALFQAVVFVLAGLVVTQGLLAPTPTRHARSLLFPVFALIGFAIIQTIPWSHQTIGGIDNLPKTISADATETREFILQFMALLLAGWLLVLQTNSRRRLRLLIEVVLVVGVCSAGFGLMRQATQANNGYFLPYLHPQFGYAQFINGDHFVFMMEMVLGLTLGIVVCRGVTGTRMALYLVAAIPLWIALVLANSRGGIFSMLCQVLLLAWLWASNRAGYREKTRRDRTLFEKVRTWAARAVLVIALFAAVVVGVIFVGGDPLARRLNALTIEVDPKIAQSYTLRLNIWQATRDLVKAHPVMGVGLGGYWIAITKYHHATGEVTPQEAHSDYLELLASAGLIGCAIGIWFLYQFIRTTRGKLLRSDPDDRATTLGALTGIATVAIHALVDYGLHVTINALLLTVLIAIVAMNPTKKAGRRNEA
jgi:O-antigen ligase